MNIRVGCTPDRSVITITVIGEEGKELDLSEMSEKVSEHLQMMVSTVKAYDSMMASKKNENNDLSSS